jgi:uncharacterized protein with von Willebrand factor type A (vWA) domain
MGSVVIAHLDMLTYLYVRREEIAVVEQEAGDDLLLPALHQDVWASAYLPDPELTLEVPPHLAVEKRLVEKLLDSPAWEEVREETVMDEWLSATLTVPTARKLLEVLPAEAEALAREAALREKKAQELEEQAARLREQAAQEQDPARQEELEAEAEAAAQAAEAERQAAAAAAGEAVAAVDAAGEKLEKALARAAFEAAEAARDAKEALEVCHAWGLEPGRPHAGVPGREVLAVAKKLTANERLRKIMRLAGRFTRVVLQKRRSRVKREPTEIAEIEIGGDLSRVLPNELSALADPVRRMDFCRRWQEKKLLQYRLDARSPQGRGPLVVCVDESGSMAGEREIWAKAVAVACFNLAAKENRAYALVHFGSAHEIRVDRFPQPRKAGPVEVLAAVEHFFGGGTDFETPLVQALRVMEESPFRRGDIIFVTDGECLVSATFTKKFAAAKKEKEFSVFAILVVQGTEQAVQPFADRIARALPGRNDVEILEDIAASA